MASNYQEARPGISAVAVPDTAVVLSAAPHSEEALRRRLHLSATAAIPRLGEFQPPEEGLVLPDNPEPPERSPEPVLIRYPQGLDMVRRVLKEPKPTNYPNNGYAYERAGFAQDASALGEREFAFGPGLLDRSFAGFKAAGVPDALVIRRTRRGNLMLDRIIEYKSGGMHIKDSLTKAMDFIAKLRLDRDWTDRISQTAGREHFRKIGIPGNREITYEMVNPNVETTPPGQFVRYPGVPFKFRLRKFDPEPGQPRKTKELSQERIIELAS